MWQAAPGLQRGFDSHHEAEMQMREIQVQGLPAPVTSSQNAGGVTECYDAAVVGSIIVLTSVIFVAGNPLISACLRMTPSSFAR